MNDAYDKGNKVLVGFRASKNPDDNCVAGVNKLYFLRDSIFNSHARTLLHLSALCGGSGFLFDRSLIEENGWDYLSLTEDAEFAFDYVRKGIKAKYVSEAIYYDEQPTNLKVAMYRHARMAKGVTHLVRKNFFKESVISSRHSVSCI